MLVQLLLLLAELVFSTGGPCQISHDVADCCRGWGGYCLTPNEMAESVVLLRKKIKDSLTRQGMWKGASVEGGLAESEGKGRLISSERAHKQVLTVKKNMYLILNSSTGTLVTVAITAPDGEFHRKSMSSQAKPAHIPHNMLREMKVQIVRRHQGGTPIPRPSA